MTAASRSCPVRPWLAAASCHTPRGSRISVSRPVSTITSVLLGTVSVRSLVTSWKPAYDQPASTPAATPAAVRWACPPTSDGTSITARPATATATATNTSFSVRARRMRGASRATHTGCMNSRKVLTATPVERMAKK